MQASSVFRKRLMLREGGAGASWLRSVPALVDELANRWSCTRDGPFRYGGVAVVAPVRGPMGPAVIKLSFPRTELRGEVAALQIIGGTGAVRLYEYAAEYSSLLLERADGPGLGMTMSVDESVETMGGISALIAVPTDPTIRALADTAPGWRQLLDEQAASTRVGRVMKSALQRAHEAIDLVGGDTTTTLLHGDLHEGNTLGATREPWLAIDLKGWAGTAAWDAFTVAMSRHQDPALQARPTPLVRQRIRLFAAAARIDADVAIEVSHARMMSSLLYETVSGDRNYGTELLRRFIDEPL